MPFFKKKTAQEGVPRITWTQKVQKLFFDPNQKNYHDFYHPPKVRTLYDLLSREYSYPRWFSLWHTVQSFKYLSEDTYWNSFICILAATGIVLVVTQLDKYNAYTEVEDIVYNVAYLVNTISLAYFCVHNWELGTSSLMGFLVDLCTYIHYMTSLKPGQLANKIKLCCYYVRLHRPFRFLQALDDYNLQSSVSGTALKYMYIFVIVRITWGLLWMPVMERSTSDVLNVTSTTTEGSNYTSNATTTKPANWTDKPGINNNTNSSGRFLKLFGPTGHAVLYDFKGYSYSSTNNFSLSDATNSPWTSESGWRTTDFSSQWLGNSANWTASTRGRILTWTKQTRSSTTMVPNKRDTARYTNWTASMSRGSSWPDKSRSLTKKDPLKKYTTRYTNWTASTSRVSSWTDKSRSLTKKDPMKKYRTRYTNWTVSMMGKTPRWTDQSRFWTKKRYADRPTNWSANMMGKTRWTKRLGYLMTTGPKRRYTARYRRHMVYKLMRESPDDHPFSVAQKFFISVYIINKMFIPVGPPFDLNYDLVRLLAICVMMSGCLIVSGAATASLSLTISMYLRPEENFRVRYRLIEQELIETKVPEDLQDKVHTFYKMYWHKQKGVSTTDLLYNFPPSLHAYVMMDIYFEAMQKCRILQELSSQFLSEVAKCMQTILFIPGDPIIKRSAKKSSIIYITYGDVEMLTAEDDVTPVLRMTRGSMLSNYGACASVACSRAQVMVRAATFCVAHVLHAPDLWYMAWRRGRLTGQGDIMLQAFAEHFKKVKSFHEFDRTVPLEAKYKSSILMFKQNLMALKEACDPSGQRILGQTDVFLEIAGSYIMRNREDISLSDDADAICLQPTFPFIFQPTSSLMAVWTWFMAVVIIAVSILIPYQLVFNQTISEDFRFYNYVISGLYLVDIYVYLSTGANVEEGVPITFTQTSSQQLRSFWFLLDVLATVPLFEFIGSGHFTGLNKLLKIGKAFRTFTGMEEVLSYESKFLRMMSYMIGLIVVTFFVAVLQQGFMCYEFGYCVVANVTAEPYWTKLPLSRATDRGLYNTLVFSIYWAANIITFTSHIDTLGKTNWANAIYTMFILEVCIVLHMFIEALYSATIMVTSGLTEQYESMIDNVKSVFMKSQVEPLLQERFITYLQLCWYTDMAYSMTHQMTTIFFDLPQHVYQNIMARQRSKYILSIPFMKYFNEEDLKSISSNCTVFYTSPNEILLCTGDISSEMYVLKQGICEVLNPDTHECVAHLKAMDHFGVLDSLLRFPAFYTVRAITHVQVISLPRKFLLDAINATPQIRQTIEFIKHQPEYRSMLSRRQRFISYEPLPPTPNCEVFLLPRRHEPDHEYMMPFKQLGALSIVRYISPRYTIRPDGRYLIRYEIMHALLTFTTAMVVPGYCYLVLDWPQLYYLMWLLDLAAYFDIAQRMIVGYFNHRGVLIYHPASTAAHYLKGAFLVDLLAVLPLENMVQAKRERFRNMFHVTLTKQCWMLNRLVQMYRLPSAMLVLEKYIERKDILLIFKALPIFLTMMNVLTCIMVFCSTRIFYAADNSHSISTNGPGGALWFKTLENMFRFNVTISPTRMHLACYFWVVYVSTTTGYNTIHPYEAHQMLTLITGMILGALIMTYVSVRIISIRSNVNTMLAEYQENMKDMIAYMHAERLDKNIKREVLNYYTHNWEKLGGVDYRHVLKLCHQINLRTDAVLHLYGSSFANCHLLADSDVALLRILGRSVRSVHFLKNARLYEISDILRNIYIVERGSVRVSNDLDQKKVLTRGSIYGNLIGPASILCPVQISADTNIHLLQINARVFHNIISDFPYIRRKLIRLRPQDECYIEGIDQGPTMPTKSKEKVIRQVFYFFYTNFAILQIYFISVALASVFADMYNVGFQINSWIMILILYALDVGFYAKVIIILAIPTVTTTDYDMQKLIDSTNTYYKSELWYDILSCIPIEAFCYSWPKGPQRLIWFSFLRLNRMFRVSTVYKRLMQYQERLYINLTLVTVVSTLIWFTLFIHANTCLWYLIGMWEDSGNPKSSWIYENNGKSLCQNAYVCSLYFVFTTFSQNGIGDIMPKQILEVIFVCILMVTSTMLSMVYVGEFSNIIQYKSFRSFTFFCRYLELQEFLKNNRVSSNLVKIVNRYSLHLWREARGEQMPVFLKKAPYFLKLKVMSAAYMRHLSANQMFMNCEPAFLRQLVGYLRLYTYNEDMDVVKQGEITDCMYMVHKGQVAEYHDDDRPTGRVFNANQQFGMLQGLQYDYPFLHSYRTVWKSQILSLRLKDWEQLLKHFPRSRDAIFRNLNQHHPDQWPSSSDHYMDQQIRYKDIALRKSVYLLDKKGEGTQTGEAMEERMHDYRKFLFDKNLFENVESSITSFRPRSALNAEEMMEGDHYGLREGPSPTLSDNAAIKETKPVKSIMKSDVSKGPSEQTTTESEALVEKFEKHVATVEFDEYLSKTNTPGKQEKRKSASKEPDKQEELEEEIVATIDMDKKGETGEFESSEMALEQQESEEKHHMIPYDGMQDDNIVVDPQKQAERVRSFHEIDEDKEGEQFLTIIEVDHDLDVETAKRHVMISDVEEHELKEERDVKEDKENDNEEEITTINIDQERGIILVKPPSISKIDIDANKIQEAKNGTKRRSPLSFDQNKSNEKMGYQALYEEETSGEKLVTTVEIDKEDNILALKRHTSYTNKEKEVPESDEKSEHKQVKQKLGHAESDQGEKGEQEFITINMDSDIELKRQIRQTDETKVNHKLNRENESGLKVLTITDRSDINKASSETNLITLQRSSNDESLMPVEHNIDNVTNIEADPGQEDKYHKDENTKKDQERNKDVVTTSNIDLNINKNAEESGLIEKVAKDERKSSQKEEAKHKKSIIIQLQGPRTDDTSEELIVEHKDDEKLITAEDNDEDEDIIPIRRDNRQLHRISHGYETEQLDTKDLALHKGPSSSVTPPTETHKSHKREEEEMVAIDIDDDEVVLKRRKGQIFSPIHSEGSEEEIMTTIDIDPKKVKKSDDTINDEKDTKRGVTYSEEGKTTSVKDRRESCRKSRPSSPSVSFKEDQYVKKPPHI